MKLMKRPIHFALLIVVCISTAHVWAGDWPQFRYDAGRTAASLDCADHLGASAGALTIGVIAVPALGIAPVCSSLALAMICVALFWFAVSTRTGG